MTPTMIHHRPSSSSSSCGPGPTSPSNEVMGRTSMSDNVPPLPLPISTCHSVNTPTLQPFNIFNSITAFNFQDMAATLGFPFTAAQWKELERQAMIYKYMVASVPVPYELLLPIIQNLPVSNSPLATQLRYSTKQDLEPGRCKRTDGKKWRCSRDVAPNQKYCERHTHRGRPRSRKHVELSQNSINPSSSSSSSSSPSLLDNANNKKTRLPNASQVSGQATPNKVVGSTSASLFPDNFHSKVISNRVLDWDTEAGSEQQWRQIMQTSHSVFNGNFVADQALNLLSFTDFGNSHEYFGPETPRRDYIDAWSTDKSRDSSVCSTGNLSSSALSLSMAMALGNSIDKESGQIHRGLGVSNMVSHVSCGGPLAEVLRPSMVTVSWKPTGDGESGNPPATTESSPSGALQRTMLSLSDGKCL